MAYVTLVVIIAAAVAGYLLCRHLIGVLADAGVARRNYRITVQGLAERTHTAKQTDRERASGSSEVAEASQMLARQAKEVQDALAFERRLRKAIRASDLPPIVVPQRTDRKKPSEDGVSA